jgi:hypothetical protein
VVLNFGNKSCASCALCYLLSIAYRCLPLSRVLGLVLKRMRVQVMVSPSETIIKAMFLALVKLLSQSIIQFQKFYLLNLSTIIYC